MRAFLDPRIQGGVRWAHVHLIAVLCVLLASSWAAAGGYLVARHLSPGGGYQPAPISAPTIKLGGGPLPAYWSLERYSVRVHNQGTSESCVGQTIATMTEILSSERGIRQAYASGYIWNQVTGGSNSPISYSDAFPRWISTGQAPLWAYGYDGQYAGPWPSTSAFQAAYPYRPWTWRLVAPADTYTIRAELSAGRPLAIAMQVYDSFANDYGNGNIVYGQWGYFQYWHSMTIVGYSPAGVIVQNSLGSGWGYGGRVTIAWSYLANAGVYIVAVQPVSTWPVYRAPPPPPPKPKPKPRAFPRKKFGPVSPYFGHRLDWAASIWLHHQSLGKALNRGHWHPRRHAGFTQTDFQHGKIWTWPRWHTAKVSFHR